MASSILTLRIDDHLKQALDALSKSTGTTKSALVFDAIAEYLDVNNWQVAGIETAIKSLDTNGGTPHAEVKKRIETWKKSVRLTSAVG